MKAVILVLCSAVVCCLHVNAVENYDKKMCEALKDEKQVCTINKYGECECTEISLNPTMIEGQEGVD